MERTERLMQALAEPDVRAVDLQLAWRRPWTPCRLTPRRLTPHGRRALRASGYALDDPGDRQQEV